MLPEVIASDHGMVCDGEVQAIEQIYNAVLTIQKIRQPNLKSDLLSEALNNMVHKFSGELKAIVDDPLIYLQLLGDNADYYKTDSELW